MTTPWTFIAMQYHLLILNRAYKVFVTDEWICGARVSGSVASPLSPSDEMNDPEFYVNHKLLDGYNGLDVTSAKFLHKDKANFQIRRSQVEKVIHFPTKWGMGAVPHSGRLVLYTTDGKIREFILLGLQDAEGLRRGLLPGAIHSPSEDKEEMPFARERVYQINASVKIENQVKGGANWLYWIAGLSILNSLIFLIGGRWNFFIGLGITQLIDGFAVSFANNMSGFAAIIIRIGGFALILGAAGIYVFLGIFAKKKQPWAFVVGMVVYGLDAFLFLWVKDYISFAIHIFVLLILHAAWQACRKLVIMKTQTSDAVQPSIH